MPVILHMILPFPLHMAFHPNSRFAIGLSQRFLSEMSGGLLLYLGPKLGPSLCLPEQIPARGICSAFIQENIAHNLC